MYTRRSPRAAVLRPFVDSLELVDDPPVHERERIVPTAEVAIIFTLAEEGFAFFDPVERRASAATVVGPASSSQVVSTQAQRGMLAVNFRRAVRFPSSGVRSRTPPTPSCRSPITGPAKRRDCANDCWLVPTTRNASTSSSGL